MSSRIWTRCAGSSEIGTLAARPWRAVEAQHLAATRRLVDTSEEQAVLESLVEAGKPPLAAGPEFAGYHYLLTTPFRYPPLRHGSRFATRHERSLWYGSKELRTAFAEVAYYRLVFLEGTCASLGDLVVDLSAFRSHVRTRRGVDLTRPPFDAYLERISSPVAYEESQALGSAMREAGVAAFRYRSARDPEGGVSVGLFTPRAFAARSPDTPITWLCLANRERIEFLRKDALARTSFVFERPSFLVGGRLPQPAP